MNKKIKIKRKKNIEPPFNLEEISELFPGIFPLEVMPEFLSSVDREIMEHIEKSIDPNKAKITLNKLKRNLGQ